MFFFFGPFYVCLFFRPLKELKLTPKSEFIKTPVSQFLAADFRLVERNRLPRQIDDANDADDTYDEIQVFDTS